MTKILFVVLTITLLIVTEVTSAAVGADVNQSGCSCAVFPENDLKPIIEQSLQYNVNCGQTGADICQKLCVALAEGARDKAPAMICEKLDKRVDNLKVAVFAKSCSTKDEWKFTGLKSPKPICCDGGKEIGCSSK